MIELLRDLLLDFQIARLRRVMNDHAGKQRFLLETRHKLLELLFPARIDHVNIRLDFAGWLSWPHPDDRTVLSLLFHGQKQPLRRIQDQDRPNRHALLFRGKGFQRPSR